jgi:hypothetical protein
MCCKYRGPAGGSSCRARLEDALEFTEGTRNPRRQRAHRRGVPGLYPRRTVRLKVHQSISGGFRRFAIGALLLAQMNLLFAAAFHHHHTTPDPAPVTEHFCPAGEHLAPAASPEAFCFACQIVRHSAGYIGGGRFTPPQRAARPFRNPLVGARVPSVPHLISRGRAPPLS